MQMLALPLKASILLFGALATTFGVYEGETDLVYKSVDIVPKACDFVTLRLGPESVRLMFF